MGEWGFGRNTVRQPRAVWLAARRSFKKGSVKASASAMHDTGETENGALVGPARSEGGFRGSRCPLPEYPPALEVRQQFVSGCDSRALDVKNILLSVTEREKSRRQVM